MKPPSGAIYAVMPRDDDWIAWCADVDIVLNALAHFERTSGRSSQIGCTVIRVEDNARIWPWTTGGGDA